MVNMFERPHRTQGELHFSGVSGPAGQATSFGKIYIWNKKYGGTPPDAAIVCLFDAESASSAAAYMSLIHPSAVVMSSRAVSARLLSFLICAKIPYLILNDSLHFSQENECRVALLDTKRNLLIVNPQLQTLNAYSEEGLSQNKNVELVPYRGLSCRLSSSGAAMLIAEPDALPRSELFDSLCELAEANRARALIAELCIPRDEKQYESFCEYTEAIFRAAVYGHFSLMLCGGVTDSQIACALSALHRVFCRLEEDGREFNGYLKKGLVIDAPLCLLCPCPMENPDLLCFDLDRLLCRLFGCELKDITEEHTASLEHILKNHFNKPNHHCKLYVKTSLSKDSSAVKAFARQTGVKDFFN